MKHSKKAGAGITLAVIITLALPTVSAFAHGGTLIAGCKDGVPIATANFSNYNGTNQFAATNNGTPFGPTQFNQSLIGSVSLGDPFITHTVVWKVTAHDGPNNPLWSPGGTIVVPPCQTPPVDTTPVDTTPVDTIVVIDTTPVDTTPVVTVIVDSSLPLPLPTTTLPAITTTTAVSDAVVLLPATGIDSSTLTLLIVGGLLVILIGSAMIAVRRRLSDDK